MDFNDKVVLITGGSRGLGRAMSRGFAKAGGKVIVASRKLLEEQGRSSNLGLCNRDLLRCLCTVATSFIFWFQNT